MNQIEQDIIIQGSREYIISDLKSKLTGKSKIKGNHLTIYVFIHTSSGVDLDVEFVGQTNEMIQEYFGGTSIILKIGELPFNIKEDYSFKMIIHY
ncbi:hypothetical protein [Faecalibacter sp. LW9]|uniref:hypothetical protein n=1 Tax=Faecalibacter sp. LW9 TaxID=3103144 RepID=UPI002AFEB49F|nr:hypothetical protein [Faecalibacter sp. LW9]